ncbi:unnamed protein product [Cuscuta europaea]|uniref:Uncharacterized protein n=1 Tax=Cuscuta europaea TaxID=41803 RepID=A0A9P0ZVT2_CUSEU|nr:unnamed protein product [Cuscuta europaea]
MGNKNSSSSFSSSSPSKCSGKLCVRLWRGSKSHPRRQTSIEIPVEFCDDDDNHTEEKKKGVFAALDHHKPNFGVHDMNPANQGKQQPVTLAPLAAAEAGGGGGGGGKDSNGIMAKTTARTDSLYERSTKFLQEKRQQFMATN